MRKIVLFMLCILITAAQVEADTIKNVLKGLNINPSAISISVKNVQTGAEVYSLHSNHPMIPASTLKVVTSAAAYNALGRDYKFKTGLYKSTNNDLYVKTGADPFLTSNDLKTLVEYAKNKEITPKHVYVDGSIFDGIEWGEGWQWDDSLNPLMPKFSAYNLNDNMVTIEFAPLRDNAAPEIAVKPFYPYTVVNLVKTNRPARVNRVTLSRNGDLAPNIIMAEGTISSLHNVKVPVYSPKVNFKLNLQSVIVAKGLEYGGEIEEAVCPKENIYLVGEVSHDINDAMNIILKNSSNYAAESLFKLAGGKYSGNVAKTQYSVDMLNDYLSSLGIKYEDINVVDGSGVSKNNLVTADFMTDFLVAQAKLENFEEFKGFLPSPGQGTLKDRMLYFKDNIWAKTGTLSNSSAITGYIVTRKNKIYAFDIMINDAKSSTSDKKNVEEQILRTIYMNY